MYDKYRIKTCYFFVAVWIETRSWQDSSTSSYCEMVEIKYGPETSSESQPEQDSFLHHIFLFQKQKRFLMSLRFASYKCCQILICRESITMFSLANSLPSIEEAIMTLQTLSWIEGFNEGLLLGEKFSGFKKLVFKPWKVFWYPKQ